jgi:hypothetical protein
MGDNAVPFADACPAVVAVLLVPVAVVDVGASRYAEAG